MKTTAVNDSGVFGFQQVIFDFDGVVIDCADRQYFVGFSVSLGPFGQNIKTQAPATLGKLWLSRINVPG